MVETSPRRPVAMVTGGRRGIGRGIALALAAKGFNLVLVDVADDADAAITLSELHKAGARAVFLTQDIADLSGHADLVGRAWAAFGAIDCLVNNAGVPVARRGDLLDDTPSDWDRVMGVNLRAPYFLTIAVAGRMIADGPGPCHRSVINLASVNSVMVSTNRGAYCLSKTGVSMMTQLFALRLAEHAIMVNEVRPGIIQTDMTKGVTDSYTALIEGGIAPIRRWGQPSDIGSAVALLASGELPFVTGESLHVDGGLHVHTL